jgi:N-acetylmuramoyl-L-alanine amidase/lysozyme
MRRFLRAAALIALCLTTSLWALPSESSAEADFRTLYADFLAGQKVRRAVAFVDLQGDGTPEMVQLTSVSGDSRTCRLSVHTVKNGEVVPMSAGDAFGFSSYTFAGVRSASFSLWATSTRNPCVLVSVSGVSKGVTTTTRLALKEGVASTQLDVALFETRSVKGRKSAYTVNGLGASSSAYSSAYSSFGKSYRKMGGSLPYQVFPSSYKKTQLSAGVARLASRYRVHATAKSVSLSKTSLTLAYGGSYTLKPSFSPASAIYETCTWKSDKEDIVRVSGGVLTAVDAGTATITVQTSSGAKKSCKVTVSPPAATAVKVAGPAHTVLLGGKLTLSAGVLPEKASQSVKWSSKDASVASVSGNVVTGRKMGTTTISAKTSNGKTASFTVTVLAEDLNKNGAIIDISRWNGVQSWSKLSQNVSFIILRCGVTYSADHELAGQMDIDQRFGEYAKQCLANGIPFGVYYYGMASTPEQARLEAEKAYSIASKYNPLFYAYDAEEAVLNGDSIEAFADRLRELGARKVGCYIAHHRYSQYKVDAKKFDFIWIPHYGKNTGEVLTTPSYKCDLHQYSSRGSVPGIAGNVDVNRLMGTKPLSFFTS